MSIIAPSSYTSLCSSPPLARSNPSAAASAKAYLSLSPQFVKSVSRNLSFLSNSISFCNTFHLVKPTSILVVRASETEAKTSSSKSESEGEKEDEAEEYEVELVQPYGLKFRKGRDGGTYIDAIGVGGSADKSGMFTVGDKVLATSAVFGEEIWPAAEYGRTMYTIRQRVGPLLMKMQKRYGKMDEAGELTEKEIIRAERNSGVISNRVREIQMQNYLRKKEMKEQRENDLRQGLQLYKNAKYEEALEKFESVLGRKPDPNEASVASYNVACCYSKLNQIQAGLSALKDALEAGFEDFKKDTWSEEEDKILIQTHTEVGNKWAEIAKRLPGRTENSVKNHWNATKRRQYSKRKCRTKNPRPSSLLQNYIKSLNLDGKFDIKAKNALATEKLFEESSILLDQMPSPPPVDDEKSFEMELPLDRVHVASFMKREVKKEKDLMEMITQVNL